MVMVKCKSRSQTPVWECLLPSSAWCSMNALGFTFQRLTSSRAWR